MSQVDGHLTGEGFAAISFMAFPGWYARNPAVDPTPVTELVRAEILNPRRPGS